MAKQKPSRSAPTAAKFELGFAPKTAADVQAQLLDVYNTTQSVGQNLANRAAVQLAVPRATVMSTEGGIDQQFRQAMMPVRETISDVENSLTAQTAGQVQGIFSQMSGSGLQFPTPENILQNTFNTGLPTAGSGSTPGTGNTGGAGGYPNPLPSPAGECPWVVWDATTAEVIRRAASLCTNIDRRADPTGYLQCLVNEAANVPRNSPWVPAVDNALALARCLYDRGELGGSQLPWEPPGGGGQDRFPPGNPPGSPPGSPPGYPEGGYPAPPIFQPGSPPIAPAGPPTVGNNPAWPGGPSTTPTFPGQPPGYSQEVYDPLTGGMRTVDYYYALPTVSTASPPNAFTYVPPAEVYTPPPEEYIVVPPVPSGGGSGIPVPQGGSGAPPVGGVTPPPASMCSHAFLQMMDPDRGWYNSPDADSFHDIGGGWEARLLPGGSGCDTVGNRETLCTSTDVLTGSIIYMCLRQKTTASTSNCIPICGVSSSPAPSQDCRYRLWTTGTLCYVLKATETPRSASDRVLAEGDPTSWSLSSLMAQCGGSTRPESPSPGPGLPPGAVNVPGLCKDLIPGLVMNPTAKMKSWKALLGLPSDGFLGFLGETADALQEGFAAFLGSAECATPEWVNLQSTKALAGLVNILARGALDPVIQRVSYAADYACPAMLPTAPEALGAWLANTIDDATLECWVRANNQRWPEFERLRDGARSKPNANEIISLWRRRLISDDDVRTRLRELGFTQSHERESLLELSTQIPPASDLVQFMVRDVEDEALVQRFGMDDEFDLKFTGKVKEWAHNQGVEEEYFSRIWRAHWHLPSPTQLFEMFHRLRPGAVPQHEQVTQADVETALKQNDLLPYWVPRMLAVSRPPLTRIDAKRAFFIGVLDRPKLKGAYQDLGYDDLNAEALTQFAEKEKQNRWKKHSLTGQYRDGFLPTAEFHAYLSQEGANVDEIQIAEDHANRQRIILRRKRCHASWRKRFLLGEFNASYAMKLLIDDKIGANVATEIIAGWDCERTTRPKQISASTICTWYGDGIITLDEAFDRLVNLGYNSKDAVGLVRECELRRNQKTLATQKRILAEKIRLVKEHEVNQRRVMSESQKIADRLERNRSQAKKAVKSRKDLELQTAFQWAKLHDDEMGDALEWVIETAKAVAADGPYPYDEVLEAFSTVTKLPTLEIRESAVTQLLEALSGLASTPETP